MNLLCLIKHNWRYQGPFEMKRECCRCGKRQSLWMDWLGFARFWL